MKFVKVYFRYVNKTSKVDCLNLKLDCWTHSKKCYIIMNELLLKDIARSIFAGRRDSNWDK
jgi:hypothetical protein